MSAPLKYPASGYTNPNALFLSLGQFWTRIFSDREMLRGLSIAQAEQLVQRYQDFVETISALSATDMPELHIENWLPIRIRLSQVQHDPYLFLPPDQAWPFNSTPTNHYFGLPHPPSAKRYVVELGNPPLMAAPLICNRVVAPSVTWVSGQNYGIINNQLWMTVDPFTLSDTMKYKVLGDDGAPVTFNRVLEGGNIETVEEQEMVLWAYRAKLDTNIPYNAFGYVFNFKDADPEICKLVLEKTTNLFTNGPTIKPLLDVIQAFAGVESVRSDGETVVDFYELEDKKWVITDKNVYNAPVFYEYTANVIVGKTLSLGDLLFDVVEYHDVQTTTGWWTTDTAGGVTLPPHVFAASLTGTLYFPNDVTVLKSAVLLTGPTRIKLADTGLVLGQAEDVAAFEAYLNAPARLQILWDAMDDYITSDYIPTYPSDATRLNFLDFLFKNLLQTNTALLKLKFATRAQATKFLNFYKVIQRALPKNVFLVIYFAFEMDQESVYFVRRSTTTGIPFAGDGGDNWGRLVTTPLTRADPRTLKFGEATAGNPNVRQFVVGKAIDLYTNTDTVIPVGTCIVSGTESGNLARVYKKVGTLSTSTINPSPGVFKTQVTGVGTKFTKDFAPGDYLVHPTTREKVIVATVSSDTVMLLASLISSNITAGADVLLSRSLPSMRYNTRRLTLLGNL